jgi:uncharacterized protein with NRDE domain
MCLVVVALAAHPRYSLVVAANRDEYHARAALPAVWGDHPPYAGMLAGRDLAAGGTWMGVRDDGRWALVTNVREGRGGDTTAPSRGELVPDVLNAPPASALAALGRKAAAYNGFNLLAVVQLSALDGPLHVGMPDGPVLAPLALPYTLPAASAPDRPKL